MNMNSKDENIADNGGIKQAYNAYKKWIKANGEEPLLPRLDSYTQEQLFFISNAQAFCSRVRPEAKMLLIRTDSHALAAFRYRFYLRYNS
jgi:predicted metalloendopeptidase